MAILKCKMCGGDLNIAEGMSVCECEYCGTMQTVPTVDDEKKLVQFERAERLRKQCEFDKAAGIYESIVADFRQEAEAYWGLVLCKYGIEYVDDPATGKKVPTCHRSSFDSVMEDSDLEQALENADEEARRVYRQEAKAIEELRRGIISVSANEQPYDIFICYKETDSKGDRTLDSVLAQDMYDALTDKGYRVFFARISLEDKLGMEYEPYIFAALNSARIMLAVGTDYEHYNAVWVKNEWSRFLKLMAKDKEKHLIPCYKGIDAYDMPREFAKLQAQDLGKMGAMQDILRGVEKILGGDKTVVQETIVVGSNPQIAPLLERAFLFLEDGEWAKADGLYEQVLNQNPKCGEAYLGKLLAELRIRTRNGLKNCALPFDSYNNYQKAVRFGDEALQTELQGYIDHIIERNLKTAYDDAVAVMDKAKSEADYLAAAKPLQELGDYADAAQLAEQCYDKAEIARKDAILADGKNEMAKQLFVNYENAIRAFKSIPGWKDADEQAKVCQEKLEKIIEENRRRIAEETKRKEAMRKKRARRGIWILGISIVVILVWSFAIRPWISYANGNYRIYINRYNIEEFTIPEGDTEIKEGAFRDCDGLTSVTIPDGVTVIGERAFAGCGALKTVEIPDSVTTIGDGAFSACISLESVTIPNSVTSISANAFSNCTALTTVTVNSQAVMDSGCFAELPSLESVIIGDSVTSISANAFSNCTALTTVTVNSQTVIDTGCFANTDIESVIIGDSVTTIGDYAFAYCDSLTSVTIPDSVTSIGNYAIYNCDALTSVTIPDSVTSIGNYAFYGCDDLTDVHFEGTKRQWQALSAYLGHFVTVHCSDGTTQAY